MMLKVLLYRLYVMFFAGNPKLSAPGKVIDKMFCPCIMMPNQTNDTMMMTNPFPDFQPATWQLDIEVTGMRDIISVDRECYESLAVGDQVTAQYIIGRFFGILHIISICGTLKKAAICRREEDNFLISNRTLSSNNVSEHF